MLAGDLQQTAAKAKCIHFSMKIFEIRMHLAEMDRVRLISNTHITCYLCNYLQNECRSNLYKCKISAGQQEDIFKDALKTFKYVGDVHKRTSKYSS